MEAEIQKLDDMHYQLDDLKNEAQLSISEATSKLIGAVKSAKPDEDIKQLAAIKVLAQSVSPKAVAYQTRLTEDYLPAKKLEQDINFPAEPSFDNPISGIAFFGKC